MKKKVQILTILFFFSFQVKLFAELVASWNFEDSTGNVLHDMSGNGNDGTISGAKWMSGVSGYSLYFDGYDDYVKISNPKPFKLQKFTVTCWIKPEDPFALQERAFFCNIESRRPSPSTGFIVRFNSQGLNFCVARTDGINWLNIQNTVNIISGCYHFVACSYDGSKMKLFFDNKLVSEASYTGGVEYNDINPFIGADPNNEDYKGYYKGNIDEMKVFDQALPSSELLSLFNEYKDQCYFPDTLITIASPTTNLKPSFYWHKIKNADNYSIRVDTTKSFLHPLINAVVTDTFYHTIVNLPADTIYWQVTANIDNQKIYTNIDSFVIIDPSLPVLIPYLPKITQERKPVLKWNHVETAKSYTIEIANNSKFLNPLYVVPVIDTQFQPMANLPCGTVYWHIKSEISPKWSISDTFRIVPDSIPLPILFNGIEVQTTTPTFKWHPVKGITTYTIRIAKDTKWCEGFVIPVSDTSYTPPLDLEDGLWYWQVGCTNNPESYCNPDSFFILATSVPLINKKPCSLQPLSITYERGKVIITQTKNIEKKAEITILTMTGKLLLRQTKVIRKKMLIDVSNVTDGMYIVNIREGDNIIRRSLYVK